MNEWVGHIQAVATSRTIWIVLALPLVACIMQPFVRAAWRVGIAVWGATLVAVLAHAIELARAPASERFVIEHLLRLVRVGQLDASVGLAFDPLAAAACAAVAGAALVTTIAARGDAPSRLAWRSVVGAATMLAIVADGFVVAIGAAQIAAIGVSALAREGRAKVALGAVVADVPIALGAALLFWGLGGGWIAERYTSDLSPRFVAAQAPGAARAPPPPRDEDDDDRAPRALPGDGLLTLTALPGAIVFVDDARVPLMLGERPLRAPFVRHPIRSGLHTFRIHGGVGVDDYVVPRVLVDGGAAIDLALVGPTLTFRQARDELAIRPPRGASPREALARRALADVPVVALASLLFLAGIAARMLRVARVDDALAVCASIGFAVYLACRLAFVAPRSPEIVAALAALAVVCAMRARDARGAAVTYGVVALVGVAAGAFAATLALVLVVVVALLALGGARTAATAALAGAPVPLLGVSWSVAAIAASTLGARASTLGVVAAILVALAGGGASYAAWRAHDAVAPARRFALALALAALAMGPALGASRRVLGTDGESLVEAWLAPGLAARDAGSSVGIVLVVFGAALAGWALGRRASPPAPARARLDAVASHAVLRVAAFVTSLDRWVLESFLGAGAAVVRIGAWGAARADAVDVGAVDAVARVPLGRVRSYRAWAYAALLAALAAVVLYSLTRA